MKNIIAILLALVFVSAAASDNSIYIDQSGDNATVTMTQDGAGNVVRGIQGVGTGNTTPSKIYGDNNQVTVNQVGSANTLSMGLVTTTGNGMANPTVNYSVTGNNATAVINSNGAGTGVSESNNIVITQTGNQANLNVNMLGSQNSLVATQAGGSNNSLVATINAADVLATVSNTGGGGNQTTLTMTGDRGTVDISTVGALNTTVVTQSGGSVYGHYAKVDITGSSNTTTISQSGTMGDSTVNLKSVGSGNTFVLSSIVR